MSLSVPKPALTSPLTKELARLARAESTAAGWLPSVCKDTHAHPHMSTHRPQTICPLTALYTARIVDLLRAAVACVDCVCIGNGSSIDARVRASVCVQGVETRA